jgi:hypothetical protein
MSASPRVSWRTGCRMKCAWAHSLPHEGCQTMCTLQLSGCHMDEPYISQPRPLTALGAGVVHTSEVRLVEIRQSSIIGLQDTRDRTATVMCLPLSHGLVSLRIIPSPACKREVIPRHSIPSWSPVLGWRRRAVPIGEAASVKICFCQYGAQDVSGGVNAHEESGELAA